MDAKDRIIEQRMAKRRQNALIIKSLIAFMILLIVLSVILLIRAGIVDGAFNDFFARLGGKQGSSNSGQPVTEYQTEKETGTANSEAEQEKLDQAARLAAQYDYPAAVELLTSDPGYNTNTDFQNAVASFQVQRDTCRAWSPEDVTHVFFHTLIYDTSKAFDGDEDEAGYNQVMTTVSEFNSIISQMYERGYVMVSLHDMCEVNEDGTVSRKEIRLPDGKKPFVLSQDDVSYYHYMDGDGFAQKLIVDENGEVKNTYIKDDGTVSVGSYDMVPLIDDFVKVHPDFAYHGHKGIIALTGYEGVLGYRTDEVYRTREEGRVTRYQQAFLDSHPDFDWDKEVEEAKKVADAMKADGWEFASHTWGHINPVGYGYDATVKDTQRWLDNVAPVVGNTDVLIFAFGADINDWTAYTMDNPFFAYLKDKGFSIFCNVDGSQPCWVQLGQDYMRQGRRNLDGYRMYYGPELLEDLFDVNEAWDESRPTPVPEM